MGFIYGSLETETLRQFSSHLYASMYNGSCTFKIKDFVLEQLLALNARAAVHVSIGELSPAHMQHQLVSGLAELRIVMYSWRRSFMRDLVGFFCMHPGLLERNLDLIKFGIKPSCSATAISGLHYK